jgi:hypothetical protein
MGDPVADIEVQLRRRVATQEQANAQRKALNDSFARLNQDQATTLLNRLLLLKPNGGQLPLDFRRLHRAVRLELVLRLSNKLGTQVSQIFHDALTRREDSPVKQGLRVMFPEHTKAQRDKFLQSLGKAPGTGVPTITLVFRNKGRFSRDNQAHAVTSGQLPNQLGPIPDTCKNQMEIRGTVSGHRPDALYRFGRTMEHKNWYRVGSTWKVLGQPETGNDNTHTSDEDNHPDNDHIYSVDDPGLRGTLANAEFVTFVPLDDRRDVAEVVYMISATETVEVKVGQQPWSPAGSLDWFSVTWLEKAGGKWRRTAIGNEIEEGTTQNLMDAQSPDTVVRVPA